MNENVRRDLQHQLKAIRGTAISYRRGVVTAVSPLTVDCGNSGAPYVGISSIAGALTVGDVVSVGMFGGDALVLGADSTAAALRVVGAVGQPAFTNAWVNFDAAGATARAAAFYKDRGRVYLQGAIKTGTINTSAFTLPVGYRPSTADVEFPALSNGVFGVLQVTLAGLVVPAAGSNLSFFLDGHSFRVG